MKRLIQLLRFPEIHSILVMNFVFDELTCAFKDYNCEISIVTNFDDLRNEGIIFLDNGDIYYNNRSVTDKIAKKCPDAVYVAWYFTDPEYKPFKNIIRLGNNMLKVPNNAALLHEYNTYTKLHDYCPFKFRANEDINLVGTYERDIQRDYCYMGFYYRKEWVPFELNGIYRASEWKDYLSYEDRKKIYLSSIFALGFHSDTTIDCGSISQRVFEGMAYGCIVLSDNPIAEKITDGIVVTVTSKDDVIQKINYYKQNPDLIVEKQNQGYEWVKKYGTNRESVKTILNKIKEVYNIEFD